MGIVSDIISDAVATVADTVYLRATDLDANTKISEIELEGKNFCLYNNLPTMSSLGEVSVTYEIPIEISVLKLADLDDTTLDGDTIRESLIPVAEQIFDMVVRNPTLSNLMITEDYNLSFEDQVEMYDSIMTGLKLSFNIHIDRTVFYCG